MSRIGLGIFLAAAVVACGPPAGRLFHTTLATPDGTYPLRVTLGDQTNLVVGFEPGPTEPFQPDLAVSPRGGPGLFGGCPAIGLLRAVRIRTSEPVAIDLIDVIGRPQASPDE